MDVAQMEENQMGCDQYVCPSTLFVYNFIYLLKDVFCFTGVCVFTHVTQI